MKGFLCRLVQNKISSKYIIFKKRLQVCLVVTSEVAESPCVSKTRIKFKEVPSRAVDDEMSCSSKISDDTTIGEVGWVPTKCLSKDTWNTRWI